MPLRRSSNQKGPSVNEHNVEEGDLRFRRAAPVIWLMIVSALVLAASTFASPMPQGVPQSEQPASQFGAIVPYLGLTVDAIEFPGVGPEEAAALSALTPLKIGDTLTRDGLHDAMKALFASGRFSDIQAEADRAETAGVRIRFLTSANFFVGIVTVDGVSTNPSQNQLVSATRLQLGRALLPR